MLMVKTKLGSSQIEGIGLFADEDIPKGTITWQFVPGFDQAFSATQIASWPETARLEMLRYTYLHSRTGMYIACLDNARFMNHSDHPNTEGVYAGSDDEGYDIATRDIAKGDELTCDYNLFDADILFKLGQSVEPSGFSSSDALLNLVIPAEDERRAAR